MINKVKEKVFSQEIRPYLYYTTANVLSIIVSIVLIPLITFYMPVDQYGISVTYFTYSSIICIFVTLSLSISVDKMMIEGDKNPLDYIFTLNVSTLILVAIYEIIIIFLSLFVSSIGSLNIIYYFYMGIYFVFSTIYLNAFYFYKYTSKYKIVFWCLIVSAPIAQLSSLLLLITNSSKIAFLRIIGYELPVILLGIWLTIKLFKGKKTKFVSNYFSHSFKISVTLIPHLLSQSLLSQASILILSNLATPILVGTYSFSYTVASVVLTLMMKLFQAWSPWFYENLKIKNFKEIRVRQRNLVLFGFFLIILFNLFCKIVLNIFVNESYLSAKGIIPILTCGFLCNYFYSFFYDIQYFNGNTKKITSISIIISILCFVMNYVFINYFGIYGAAFANLLCYVLLFLMHLYLLRKEQIQKIFNVRLMILCMLLSIVLIVI